LNREGKYLQACVWVSSLTGKDLTNLSYVPDFGVDFQRRASLIRRCAVDAAASFACTRTIKMLPDEKWWGLCNAFGREMPFTEKTEFSCDLRLDNYSHQSLSFLCSDKGRVIWCSEPIGVKISGGEIRLESDKGEIIVKRGVL
jgi:hypothetical protein